MVTTVTSDLTCFTGFNHTSLCWALWWTQSLQTSSGVFSTSVFWLWQTRYFSNDLLWRPTVQTCVSWTRKGLVIARPCYALTTQPDSISSLRGTLKAVLRGSYQLYTIIVWSLNRSLYDRVELKLQHENPSMVLQCKNSGFCWLRLMWVHSDSQTVGFHYVFGKKMKAVSMVCSRQMALNLMRVHFVHSDHLWIKAQFWPDSSGKQVERKKTVFLFFWFLQLFALLGTMCRRLMRKI